ncbi:MAG: hypothetical protein AB7E49_01875 [Campylobacterales bacterium]
MTNAQRQKQYRQKAKAAGKVYISGMISKEAKKKLAALAKDFACSPVDALEHIIHYAHDEVKWVD